MGKTAGKVGRMEGSSEETRRGSGNLDYFIYEVLHIRETCNFT